MEKFEFKKILKQENKLINDIEKDNQNGLKKYGSRLFDDGGVVFEKGKLKSMSAQMDEQIEYRDKVRDVKKELIKVFTVHSNDKTLLDLLNQEGKTDVSNPMKKNYKLLKFENIILKRIVDVCNIIEAMYMTKKDDEVFDAKVKDLYENVLDGIIVFSGNKNEWKYGKADLKILTNAQQKLIDEFSTEYSNAFSLNQ